MRDRHDICLFGASPDTGNQGVTALCWSTLGALQDAGIDGVTVFDHGKGLRQAVVRRGPAQIAYGLVGARPGRRVWRRDHLLRLDLDLRVNGLGRALGSDAARAFRAADAILDLSGGDSFADLYGPARFRAITAPKRLALREGRPLILLPQTYGPFRTPRSLDLARELIAGARQAWARDVDSHARMQALLGTDFDPLRHRLGVDMAFGLWGEPVRLDAQLSAWFSGGAGRERPPVVGVNVSGLLANDPAARARFDLRADYARAVEGIVDALLAETDVNILLVPHVHAPVGQTESDLAACRALLAHTRSAAGARGRVAVLEAPLDARQLKWLVSRLDWFCGARMHATIAGLSTGVPTAGLAYSLKARGVFACCEAERSLFDLRTRPTDELVADVLDHFADRDAHAAGLRAALPSLRRRLSAQHALIAAAVTGRHAAASQAA
ncbi:MAG: polysaccharide pyruvyl transferase family protein [Pseudomonadales bacterium]|jgi:polysaccharide pyruvyl transferase WcaK-like protein|nr:polysaccharide pyruvyl transferase family protein [Pseudomonadales bacterium]